MDDDAGPQSLFVVVSWDSVAPNYSSIIKLETQVHNHEYASSSAIETEFSAHIPRLPQVQRPISWAISLPPESSSEDLYMLPDCAVRKSEIEKDGKLPGFIFNLSTKKCKIIKPPLASKYMGHVVTMGDHIYFVAQPCWGNNSPVPRFERYDTLSQSWEEREPLPLFTNRRIGLIEGSAVLDDTILFNFVGLKMWAYNVGRDKWYPVTVKDNLCYNIVGVAVVLNKIIYAITEFCESVVAMTLKSQEIEGDLVFTCDLHKEYVVPGMEQVKFDLWDSYHLTRHLVHLGKDNKFCVVQSCNNDDAMNQYIQVTYIEVSDKKSIVTNICLHEFKLPRGDQFIIRHCFSMPKCKTTALEEGNRFLKLNPEHEAEIVTLPPELLQFQDKYSLQTNIIDEQGGSVSQTSQSRDDANATPEVQEDVPKKSSASVSESFADVEFESVTSKQNAIKASIIEIGGSLAVIEEKRGSGLTQVSQTSQSRDNAETKTPQVQEDVPKKSSASVVAGKSKFPSKASTVTGRQSHGYATKASTPTLGDGAASGRSITDEEGHSICVTNLPLDANSRQLINRLKRFGPIKGVVIQTYFDNNMGECCFGHVEFESATSKQNAIQASTMEIGGRIAVIEEKRGTGHSICVTNLPLDANCRQLVKRLKRFGFIKSVEIKSYFNNMSECCFADVEFESATSKQNAIKESILKIGNHIAVIEEKRGTGFTQGDSNRSSSSPRNKLKKRGFEDYRSKTSRKGWIIENNFTSIIYT